MCLLLFEILKALNLEEVYAAQFVGTRPSELDFLCLFLLRANIETVWFSEI